MYVWEPEFWFVVKWIDFFFLIIINNMPTKATRCLRKQIRKVEDGANFDVNNTINVDCKYK